MATTANKPQRRCLLIALANRQTRRWKKPCPTPHWLLSENKRRELSLLSVEHAKISCKKLHLRRKQHGPNQRQKKETRIAKQSATCSHNSDISVLFNVREFWEYLTTPEIATLDTAMCNNVSRLKFLCHLRAGGPGRVILVGMVGLETILNEKYVNWLHYRGPFFRVNGGARCKCTGKPGYTKWYIYNQNNGGSSRPNHKSRAP